MHQPAGLAYLAASLEKSGIDVKVFDLSACSSTLNDLKRLLEDFQPDIVGITTNIAIARQSCVTGLFIKAQFPQIKVIFGGPWASMSIDFILQKRICDIVVVGEGEETIVELCQHYEKGLDLKDVAGLAYLDQRGAVSLTNPRSFIDDLDSLAFPAWHLFPDPRKYMHFNRYFPFFPLLATRGCVFDCIHCTKFIHGYKIRYRSVENIIAELKWLKKEFKAKEIHIIDDNFTMDREYCLKVLKEIVRSGLDFKINFANGIRADTVTPAMIHLMKRAGVYSIALGVESGNDYILRAIGKRTSTEKIKFAADLIKKNGLFLRTFFILGLPGDNIKTMQQTIDFSKRLDADYAHFFIANPFPGTKMNEILRRTHPDARVLFSGFYNKVNESNYVGFVPWKTVDYFHKKAHLQYYLNPIKPIRIISRFRTFQDFRWMLNFVALFFGEIIEKKSRKHPAKVKT
jgi:radical SAM superfamily enzyme YgiQ (UPF0313 family)